MNLGASISTVVACVAASAALIFSVQSCEANSQENTRNDTKRMQECVKAGGSWVNGYSGNQCLVVKEK